MNAVKIYTTRFCGYCLRAKALLESKQIPYEEIPVDGDREARADLMQRTGRSTVPQIWIGERHIGGCNELMRIAATNELDRLIAIN